MYVALRDWIKRSIVIALLKIASVAQRVLAKLTLGRFPPFCSVLALAERQGKFLVIYHKVHQAYTFAGGYMKFDETPEEALRRELLEETGLIVHPEALVGAYRNTSGVQSINLIYACTVDNDITRFNYEGKCAWLNEKEFFVGLLDHCQQAFLDYKRGNA
jgi:8-oxo-dGTP diphosphatase